MSDTAAVGSQSAGAPLNVPQVQSARYKRNFIRQAVCELRFPTLYELEEERPPKAFAHALRKDYPNQQFGESVKVGAGPVTHTKVHTFSSSKPQWSVALKAASVSLETSNYNTFEEFKGRLSKLIDAVRPVIDSDFFTRVGLRYINAIPYSRGSIGRWVNPALVGALAEGRFGDPSEYVGQILGTTAIGGFRLQHGLASVEGKPRNSEYGLDFDFFAEDIPVQEALATVERLKEMEFSFFMWTLGPEALDHMSRLS